LLVGIGRPGLGASEQQAWAGVGVRRLEGMCYQVEGQSQAGNAAGQPAAQKARRWSSKGLRRFTRPPSCAIVAAVD